MAKDRDACLAAGMDAYLSKPLLAELLLAELLLKTIEQLSQSQTPDHDLPASSITKSGVWRHRNEKPRPKPSNLKDKVTVSDTPDHQDLWNPAVALRRMGADTGLLSSMVDYFLEDSPLLLQQLKERIDAGDTAEACRVAHSLKGLCANFEAEAATRASELVEAACTAENMNLASILISPLTEQLCQLSPALAAWSELNSQRAG